MIDCMMSVDYNPKMEFLCLTLWESVVSCTQVCRGAYMLLTLWAQTISDDTAVGSY